MLKYKICRHSTLKEVDSKRCDLNNRDT